MKFLNFLGILSAGGIGAAAGGIFGFPFLNKTSTKDSHQQNEIISTTKEEPVLAFDNSLDRDQVDVLKTIWRDGDSSNKNLIDYFDYQGWMNKASEYSVLKEKWPWDIIFIKDKSDKNLGEQLRNKCYSAAQWFFLITRSDNNADVKELMKNVDGGFSLETTKDLCTTDTDTLPKDIKNVKRTKIENTGTYTCENESTSSEQWIKEVYEVKKDYYSSGGTVCRTIKETPVIEIEYMDGTKKYQFLKSRKSPNGSDYESIPGDGKIYSSILEIPGLLDLFGSKK